MATEGDRHRLTRVVLAVLIALASAVAIGTLASKSPADEAVARTTPATATLTESTLAKMDKDLDKLITAVDKKGAEKVDVDHRGIGIRVDKYKLADELFFTSETSSLLVLF